MSIGEHLDELRSRVIRSLVAVVAACLLCIWPARWLLVHIVARPVVLALQRHGQPANLLATGPAETLVIYIKTVLFCGLLLAAPYVLHQIWGFVASGLYRREKEWVYRLIPVSVGLFFAGVVFMYVLVLLVSLNFLIGFSSWFPLPDVQPNVLERMLLHEELVVAPASGPAGLAPPTIPIVAVDPTRPPAGAIWLNLTQQLLKVQSDGGTFSLPIQRSEQRSMITTHFKIGEYLTFVLIMTLAFGLAFQIPLVVVFLVRSGIVRVQTFAKYRKAVILAIVILAGMIAPPDLMSHLLLSGPMLVLFEAGLLWARWRPSRESRTTQEA